MTKHELVYTWGNLIADECRVEVFDDAMAQYEYRGVKLNYGHKKIISGMCVYSCRKPVHEELCTSSIRFEVSNYSFSREMVISPANIKGANEEAKIKFVLCSHTIHEYNITSTFLLASSPVRSKQLLCFVHGQGQKSEQKHTTKKFVEFHNHYSLITLIKYIVF